MTGDLVARTERHLSRFVADRPALLSGVLLVLLTPCIDHVRSARATC